MNDLSPEPPFDKQIRCPQLGGPVTFEYCVIERATLPCKRAVVCWSAHFDVEFYFKQRLSTEEFADCFLQPAQPKIVSLVELIERARKGGT